MTMEGACQTFWVEEMRRNAEIKISRHSLIMLSRKHPTIPRLRQSEWAKSTSYASFWRYLIVREYASIVKLKLTVALAPCLENRYHIHRCSINLMMRDCRPYTVERSHTINRMFFSTYCDVVVDASFTVSLATIKSQVYGNNYREIQARAESEFGGRWQAVVSKCAFAYVNWYTGRNICRMRTPEGIHLLVWKDWVTSRWFECLIFMVLLWGVSNH